MASDTIPLLELRAFPGGGDAEELGASTSPAEDPFHRGLASRRLMLQACVRCGRLRYPVAPVCPSCFGSDSEWTTVKHWGAVHSWVRYHCSYLPEFRDLVPYVVVTVQLVDGPLLVGRLAEPDVEPEIGMPIRVIVESWSQRREAIAFVRAG